VALKALEIYERERLVERAAGMAPQFRARLAALATHPLVGEARGYGLVGAVELVADKASKRSFDPKSAVGPRAVALAEQEGLLLRFLAGDVISICPPLVITAQEIDELFDRLGRALDQTLDWARREGVVQA
jgi:4-aminobutyrate--pyruvate transaminase